MEYIRGHAKFTGPREVTVDGVKYTGEKILIATGTKPIVPSVPGGAEYVGDVEWEVLVWGCVEWGGACVMGEGCLWCV